MFIYSCLMIDRIRWMRSSPTLVLKLHKVNLLCWILRMIKILVWHLDVFHSGSYILIDPVVNMTAYSSCKSIVFLNHVTRSKICGINISQMYLTSSTYVLNCIMDNPRQCVILSASQWWQMTVLKDPDACGLIVTRETSRQTPDSLV